MILLFENIFQNNTFSTNGWDFVWNNVSTGESTSIHYNTSMLMDAIYKESLVYGMEVIPVTALSMVDRSALHLRFNKF